MIAFVPPSGNEKPLGPWTKNRLRIHNLWAQNGLSKTKSPKLNTHEAFLCLTQSILVTRVQPHIPEICMSTLSVNHTINDFRGNHNTS